ncbi:hypothetical protein DAPPUDRAFT_314077 [Daphnia pulex]|uniref:Caspase family p20 domain-containing protein n=1 Tax=Daphnia pulex TaxID=6669 RepID=E9G4M1_DAPPU|nr:hypothetical protein DAPPUDRAFT_314077 [Daphnia pulex]|eukprot:EFX85532.1 hypothetical protein DAPPUDRAFT_314077 [Daphnia pulex]
MDLTDANPIGNQLQTPVQAPRRKTSRAECPVDRDSPVYNMKHRRRGKAYIFNHECFDPSLGLSRRVGSSTDVSNLQIALHGLGFQVFYFNDRGVCDVRKIIQELANEDHSECDCVMVVVLSHGENGMIYTYDSVYHSDELWFPFTSDKCPSLAGKPKLFFIQACQGSQMDKGTLMQCDSAKERDSVVEEYSIPTLADFMIAYSTVPAFIIFEPWANHKVVLCQFWFCWTCSSNNLNIIAWISSMKFDCSIPLFFKCPRVCPCECGSIHEDLLFPIPPAGFNSSTDGAPVDAWPYFP